MPVDLLSDRGVALALFCGSALAICAAWLHGPLWCAWLRAFERHEPAPVDLAHDLVAHARTHGRADALGWRVTREGQFYLVETPQGSVLSCRSAAQAIEAIEHRVRAGVQ